MMGDGDGGDGDDDCDGDSDGYGLIKLVWSEIISEETSKNEIFLSNAPTFNKELYFWNASVLVTYWNNQTNFQKVM